MTGHTALASLPTHPAPGLEALYQGAILSPFTRLRRLLEGVAPGIEPTIDMTVGEPREPMPAFVADKLAESQAGFAKYPQIRGTDAFRSAIAAWIARRYAMARPIDENREIHPLNGSREGLYFAILPAMGRKRVAGRPAVLMPNPYYQAYIGSAYAANAEPVLLNATAASGFLPDLDRLEARTDVLERTVAFYLCSPANPQGAVASRDYVARALALARQYDFMLFFDECYSEIYGGEPPVGGLEVASATADGLRNIVVFNSLSKRSNLPGLRSGFCAGDGDFLEAFAEIRNLTAPQVPMPVQHASAAIWAEEQHVAVIRQAYRAKFDVCDQVLGNRFGYRRPAGGFFLWLDMTQFGGGLEAALTLWKRCGVRIVPGAFLAQPDDSGVNPGEAYVRVALVHEPAVIRTAMERIVALAP